MSVVAPPPTPEEAAAIVKGLRERGASDWLVQTTLDDLGYVPPRESDSRGVYQYLPTTWFIDIPEEGLKV